MLSTSFGPEAQMHLIQRNMMDLVFIIQNLSCDLRELMENEGDAEGLDDDDD